MNRSAEKKNYISPVTEAITLQVEHGILQESNVNGDASTTAYDDGGKWN